MLRQHQIPTSPVRIGSTYVLLVSSVRDFGVHIDSDVSLRTHITATVKSINQFITRHCTKAHATMSPSQTEKECLKSVLENVNGWSSPTAQWKRVPESWCHYRETTSSSVDVV